jgi:exosome complex exonuclease DIS3/RRP44
MRALTKVAQFRAAETLPANFQSTAQSAAQQEDEAPVLPHVYVFADSHHRVVYAQAQALANADSSFKARYVNAMARAEEERELMGGPAALTDDDDDDGYAEPAAAKQLRSLARTIEISSSLAAHAQQARSLATEAADARDEADEASEGLMLAATRWLQRHMGARACVVLLTNDAAVAQRAGQVGVAALSAEHYVQAFAAQCPSLSRVLAQTVAHAADHDRAQWVYEAHLPMPALKTGVARGELHKGVFNVNRDYWTEASVMTGEHGRVLIPDMKHMNRAVNGDIVVIRVLPKSEWRAAATGLAPDAEEAVPMDGVDEAKAEEVLDDNAAGAEKVEEQALPEVVHEVSAAEKKSLMPTGEVVGVWEQQHRTLCGSLENTDKKSGYVMFCPVNRCFPKVRVESRQITDLVDQRVVVAIDSWPITSKHPYGHLVRKLGSIGDVSAETEVLLLEHEIRHDRWSAAVEACLPAPDYEISPEERAGRVDLRDVCICSIDPPGCTDIDDALHCIQLPDGTFEVGVHIADVTHYVQPGSALDLEAAARSTSVYLADRRIDMIPARLSTNLCSLRSNVERLAFSTVWRMNADAEILETRFFKSVIKSKAALMYSEAQTRIDSEGGEDDPVTMACKNLMMLARKIKQGRLDDGALVLASAQVKFEWNKSKPAAEERSQLDDISAYELKEANSLVEEFMLLANVSVAKHILQAFPTMALLRRHPTPAPEMLEPLVKAGRSWGFDMDISSNKALSTSLNTMQDPNDAEFNKVVRMVATRCMTQAKYLSSGEFSDKATAHFGLACSTYTHFTSPIRRYADVIVHRLLAASLGIAPLPDMIRDKAHMRDVVDNLNHRHRLAQYASRASTDVWTLQYFAGKHVEAEAVVLAVRATGVRVLVPRYGVECAIRLVPRGSTSDVFTVPEGETTAQHKHRRFVYDPNNVCITVGGETLRIFQRVPVSICVKENDLRRRWLHVELQGDVRERLFNAVPELKQENTQGRIVTPSDTNQAEIVVEKEKDTSSKPMKKRRTK